MPPKAGGEARSDSPTVGMRLSKTEVAHPRTGLFGEGDPERREVSKVPVPVQISGKGPGDKHRTLRAVHPAAAGGDELVDKGTGLRNVA